MISFWSKFGVTGNSRKFGSGRREYCKNNRKTQENFRGTHYNELHKNIGWMVDNEGSGRKGGFKVGEKNWGYENILKITQYKTTPAENLTGTNGNTH